MSHSHVGSAQRGRTRWEAITRHVLFLALLGLATPVQAQLVAPADAPDGATLFRRQCATCHALQPGEARQGPHLAGVYGRQAGTVPGFKYSAGFAAADWTWDDVRLDAYLANPQAVIKGGVMGYRQAKPEVRQGIIDYLREQH